MAEIKITSLAAISDPASTDVLPIVDVSADITNKISIADLLKNATTGSASSPSFAFDGDSNTGMYRSGADALAFSTGGTGRLFITSSGNIGVGTSSPTQALHIARQSTPKLIVEDTSNNVKAVVGANNTIGRIGTESNHDLTLRTNDIERIRINTAGNVGIGTTSPSQKLHVYENSTAAVSISLGNTEGTYKVTANSNVVTHDTSQHLFRNANGGSEYARIDSSGKLRLKYAQQFEYNTASTDSRTWYFNNDVHAYGDFAIRRSTTQTGSTFETKYLFHANGGICFNGDTAEVNALDDYDEGNWTPSLIGSTTDPALTYSTRGGRYEKIGAFIHCSFFMHVSAVTTQGSGQLRIGGLPFNGNSNVAAGEVPAVLLQSEPFSDGDGANRVQFARTAGNADYMLCGYKDLTTGGTAVPSNGAANVGTGYFIGHVTYRVN